MGFNVETEQHLQLMLSIVTRCRMHIPRIKKNEAPTSQRAAEVFKTALHFPYTCPEVFLWNIYSIYERITRVWCCCSL